MKARPHVFSFECSVDIEHLVNTPWSSWKSHLRETTFKALGLSPTGSALQLTAHPGESGGLPADSAVAKVKNEQRQHMTEFTVQGKTFAFTWAFYSNQSLTLHYWAKAVLKGQLG